MSTTLPIKDAFLLWNNQDKGYLKQDEDSLTDDPGEAGLFTKPQADMYTSMRNHRGGVAFFKHYADAILHEDGKPKTSWTLVIQKDIFVCYQFENDKKPSFQLKHGIFDDTREVYYTNLPTGKNEEKPAVLGEVTTWAWRWRDYENDVKSPWQFSDNLESAKQQAKDSALRHNVDGGSPSLMAALKSNIDIRNNVQVYQAQANNKTQSPAP